MIVPRAALKSDRRRALEHHRFGAAVAVVGEQTKRGKPTYACVCLMLSSDNEISDRLIAMAQRYRAQAEAADRDSECAWPVAIRKDCEQEGDRG